MQPAPIASAMMLQTLAARSTWQNGAAAGQHRITAMVTFGQ